jgi:ribosomal-protein-alanine N-acetyltransferase
MLPVHPVHKIRLNIHYACLFLWININFARKSNMKIFAETGRLILRELMPSDAQAMLRMDSNPEVMKFLGKTISTIEEARGNINMVRAQYERFGIGRWAMIEKSSGEFIGWTGLKMVTELYNGHKDFYDLGYRMIPAYWGKGYATESAMASLAYGFRELQAEIIYGRAATGNRASINVLKKSGLKYIETFDSEGVPHIWLKIMRKEWENNL